MTKREISEIKRLFKKGDNSFTRLCGCYVHGEERISETFCQAFQSLPEEDANKYLDIFKKTLSGGINKNLFSLTFPNEKSANDCRSSLEKIVNSELKDENILETFYQRVIELYDTMEDYVILIIHNRYDVPGKGLDGIDMEDASEDVYSYIVCAVCPVKLSEPGLGYRTKENDFASLERDRVIEMPEFGFLYPSFNERSTDLWETLYYSANAKALNKSFIEDFLYAGMPIAAPQQMESFCSIVDEVFEQQTDYQTVCAIKDSMDEYVAQKESDGARPEDCVLEPKDLKDLIEKASGKEIDDQTYSKVVKEIMPENGKLFGENLTNPKIFELKTSSAVVRVNTELTSKPEIRKIDGRNCIVVPIEGELKANGMIVKP